VSKCRGAGSKKNCNGEIKGGGETKNEARTGGFLVAKTLSLKGELLNLEEGKDVVLTRSSSRGG